MRSDAELVALFGREVVNSAIANQDAIRDWKAHHRVAVIKVIQDLQLVIHSTTDAVSFVAKLDSELREALIVTLLDIE